MKKLKTAFSIVAALSLLTMNISFANAKEHKPITTGAYYSEDGELVGVRNITGELSEDETEILLNLFKPENSAGVKLYKYEADGAFEASGMFGFKSHDINIINTGNMRGYIVGTDTAIGMDKIASLKTLTPNSLLFDAGDATQGVSYAALTRGEDVIFTMNSAGYDGMVLGNHEFNYGFETLLTNVSIASFPVMAANVAFSEREDSRSIKIPANEIYEVNGYKVGVFGITTKDTKAETNPEGLKDVDFKDEIETAKEQVEYLKNEGVDIIIALTHIGTGKNTSVTSSDLAKAMEGSGLDLIIDGHGTRPEVMTEGGITIAYAGSNGEFAGDLGIDISDNGGVNITPVLLGKEFFENIPSDTRTGDMINTVLDEQNSLLGNVVSYSGTTLWGGEVNGIFESRTHETNLGDYICDRMIEKVRESLGESYTETPVVAVENGGGMCASIPIGEVTWQNIIDVLPFSNTVKYKLANPKIIYDMLEASVSCVEGQDKDTGKLTVDNAILGIFLQVGGMNFEYDPNAAAGSKVKAVYLDGYPGILDRDDTDTEIIIVSNDYIIGGGDGFDMLGSLPQMGECGGLAEMLTTALGEYDSKNPLEYPVTQNRIRTTGSYKAKNYTASIFVMNADESPIAEKELTYYLDGERKKGKTDAYGLLKITVPDGPHSVSLDKKTEVYINNYSGAGVDMTIDFPHVSYNTSGKNSQRI